MNLKTKTTEEFSQKVWKELFRAAGHEPSSSSKDKKKKKDKKTPSEKKKNRSSGSSTSSSSSSSSSSEKPQLDAAARRQEETFQRKARLIREQEAKKAAKAAEAEALKAERAAHKAASEAAKARQKEALAKQTVYKSLFDSHAQLIRDMCSVTSDKRDCEKYEVAQELATRGEAMIDEALGAMREKSDLDKAGITGFIKDQKRISGEMVKLAKKKRK